MICNYFTDTSLWWVLDTNLLKPSWRWRRRPIPKLRKLIKNWEAVKLHWNLELSERLLITEQQNAAECFLWNADGSMDVVLIFGRKIFRRIYGAKYENGEWKSQTKRELEDMRKGENIVIWIKRQRIGWLGHLERVEEDRMPKKIFTQELEGTRRRGRPRKGWKEEAERDLRVLGVRRWRELAADRKKWKDIFWQAKAHSGL